nr:dihydroneopterin aldolase [Rhodospirillales bacterium]
MEGVLSRKQFSGWQRIHVEGLIITCLIGIREQELLQPQRIQVDIELVRREPDSPTNDNYGRVICYQAVVEKVRAMTSDSSIKLVETLAERIADACYADYPDLTSLNVKIGKPDIFTDVSMVRVELERIFNKEVS